MSKKAKHGTDVIEARVIAEREWAYARWLERLTWPMMRLAAALPPSEGGLGYDLPPQALKGLVAQARADAGDLTMGREERLERQLIEVDARARAARHDMEQARRDGEADAYVMAEKRLDIAQDREAKLVGLYAATQVEANVVHHDAVTLELNAMLERAGRKPIKTPTPEG